MRALSGGLSRRYPGSPASAVTARRATVVLAAVLLTACTGDERDTPPASVVPAATVTVPTTVAPSGPAVVGTVPAATPTPTVAATTLDTSLPLCEDPDDVTDPDEAPCRDLSMP